VRRFMVATAQGLFFAVLWIIWGLVLIVDYCLGGFLGLRLNLDCEFDDLKWRQRYKLSPKTLKYKMFAPWELSLPFLSAGVMITRPGFGTVLVLQLSAAAAIVSMAATINRSGMSAEKWAWHKAGLGQNYIGP
jgi:hypothetical protein